MSMETEHPRTHGCSLPWEQIELRAEQDRDMDLMGDNW